MKVNGKSILIAICILNLTNISYSNKYSTFEKKQNANMQSMFQRIQFPNENFKPIITKNNETMNKQEYSEVGDFELSSNSQNKITRTIKIQIKIKNHNNIVTIAKKYLGTKYVWGGTNPKKGLDCSGFTQLVYSQLGVQIPRVSREQAQIGVTITDKSQLKKGDLLFFKTTNRDVVSHVGIYIGDNKMIHASSTNKKVVVVNLNSYNGYFKKKFSHVKRVVI